MVVGKKGDQYVRVAIKKGDTLNGIIMGSTGCGKSVLLLTMLLYQNHISPDPMTFFVLDIKPDLARKSVVIKGNQKVRTMDPENRNTYGCDVYYRLKADTYS